MDVLKLSNAVSDIQRTLKTRVLGSADDSGNRVKALAISRKTLVKDVMLEIQQAYTAASTGTVTVGYIDNKDGSFDNDYFLTDTEAASEVVGYKSARDAGRQYYFEKGGFITISIAKGDSAADVKCRAFVDTAVVF